MKSARVVDRALIGIAILSIVGGCAFGDGALRTRAASDLSCPEHQLETRCVVGTKGDWVVTGCGRYARYTKTSHGPRLGGLGSGQPPEAEWLCAKGF